MKTRLARCRAVVVVVGLVLVGFSSVATAAERKVDVDRSQLPDNIKKAIEEAVPGGQVVRIQKEVEGEDPGQYDVDIRADGNEYEVEISPDGDVKEVKQTRGSAKPTHAKAEKKYTDAFGQEHCTFATTGKNRFFILEPGYQLVLESRDEKVAITVLDATVKVGDVETRVVEEREWEDGQLKEVSRNYFAICAEHGDVFYFGEEVDNYKDGKVVKHSGEWRADEEDSKPGLMMPATVLLGARFYQEISPNAQDRAEIIRDDVTMKTPAGTFKNCIKIEETNPLEPGEKDFKIYAPGIGMIQDEDLKLTYHGPAKANP